MVAFWILLLVGLTTGSLNHVEYLCPPGWSYFNGNCYRAIESGDYDTSRSRCHQQCSELVTIESEAENEFARKLTGSAVWIGYRRNPTSAVLISDVTGAETVYTNWANGILDYDGNCVRLGSDGFWWQDRCHRHIQAMCKKSSFHTAHCPFGWCHHRGKCYKDYAATMSWSDGERVCRSQNGYLVTIGSMETADFVNKTFLQPNGYRRTHMGLRGISRGEDGFMLDGELIEKALLDEMNPEETGDCVMVDMTTDAKVRFMPCDQTFSVIVCEKMPVPPSCWSRTLETRPLSQEDKVEELTAGTVNLCKDRCAVAALRHRCSSFTFDRETKRCVFYANVAVSLRDDPSVDYYQMQSRTNPKCPAGWCSWQNQCLQSLYLGTNRVDWLMAQKQCSAFPKGTLVETEDVRKMDMVAQTFLRDSVSVPVNARDVNGGGEFMWPSGGSVSAEDWLPGEPNNFDQTETCMEAGVFYDLVRYNDIACSHATDSMNMALCEIESTSLWLK